MIRRSVINRGGVAVSLSLLLSPAHPALAQAVWQNAPGTRADTGGANGLVHTKAPVRAQSVTPTTDVAQTSD